jgi:hypothetical protein
MFKIIFSVSMEDVSDDDLLAYEENEVDNEVNEKIAEISIENQKNDFDKDLDEVKTEKIQKIGLPDFKRKSVKIIEPGVKEVNRKRKGLSLANLLKNKVISATSAKPVDPNSMEGQRELIARRDRDLKTVAKQTCIERFNTVDIHLAHWGVS